MTWLWLVLVVVVLGVTTAVAAGRGDRMRPAYSDRPDVRLPASRMVDARDLTQVRFSVALRGYRMDEVDDLIGRLAREIALRDTELARLTNDREPAQVGGAAAAESEAGGEVAAAGDPARADRADARGADADLADTDRADSGSATGEGEQR